MVVIHNVDGSFVVDGREETNKAFLEDFSYMWKEGSPKREGFKEYVSNVYSFLQKKSSTSYTSQMLELNFYASLVVLGVLALNSHSLSPEKKNLLSNPSPLEHAIKRECEVVESLFSSTKSQ